MYDECVMSRLLPLLLVSLLAVAAPGQNPLRNCPTIQVSGPGVVGLGTAMKFTAEISGPAIIGDVGYSWTISAGTITEGQGTRSMTVDIGGLQNGTTVTATVLVRGIPSSCMDSASESASRFICVLPMTLDIYESPTWNDERGRLDAMLSQMKASPSMGLYFILKMTPKESFDDARKHARKMLGHFMSRDKQFDPAKLNFVAYITDRHETVAYLQPKDAIHPECDDASCVGFSGSDLLKK